MPKVKVVFEYGEGDKVNFILLSKSDTRTPEEVANELIKKFNRNIKDTDKERKVVSCEISNYQEHAHEWILSTKKTKVASPHDVMECRACNAEGLRFGFSENVTPNAGFTHICRKVEFKLKFE